MSVSDDPEILNKYTFWSFVATLPEQSEGDDLTLGVQKVDHLVRVTSVARSEHHYLEVLLQLQQGLFRSWSDVHCGSDGLMLVVFHRHDGVTRRSRVVWCGFGVIFVDAVDESFIEVEDDRFDAWVREIEYRVWMAEGDTRSLLGGHLRVASLLL